MQVGRHIPVKIVATSMLPYLTEENLEAELIMAIEQGHILVVQYLLDTNLLDLNSKLGRQAIIHAGSEWNVGILELLLSKGAHLTFQQPPPHIPHPKFQVEQVVVPMILDGMPMLGKARLGPFPG